MKRFKTLLSRQGSSSTSFEDASPVEEQPPPPEPVQKVYTKEDREFSNDPVEEAEVIASIEEQYFTEDTFDCSNYELEKLTSEQLDLAAIDEDRNKLRRQLQAVSKKFSDVVLENQSAYTKELQRVMELQASLQKASVICMNGRRQLSMTKQGFTVASLRILKNHRKKQQLLGLLKSLHTIDTLQRTDIRLRELMEEEDYPGAIQLCQECQRAASNFKHYKCISELSSKLQDTLEMIEEQLDNALAKICSNFDIKNYEKLQTAYRLLGKTQTAMDQLHMHFTSAIHNTAFQIILGYVQLVSGPTDSRFQKMPYRDLCSQIHMETYIPCLVDLCKALWEVMKSYYKTLEWHDKQESSDQATTPESEELQQTSDVEESFSRRYIRKKLEHGLARIWQDVQQKVKTYLQGTDLSSFKYDDFIYVLDLVNRLISVGEEFCGSKSEGLHDSIRQQSLNYFKSYHRARMDELRMFLENEGWEMCPVKSNFSFQSLHEFRFLREYDTVTSNTGSRVDGRGTVLTSPTGRGFFSKYAEQGSPFDKQFASDEEEDEATANGPENERFLGYEDSDDSDVPDELKQDYVDEKTGEQPVKRNSLKKKKAERAYSKGPILTNTTLTVLRLCGKYMNMMSVLKPIAFDVVLCMSQLFDYYIFAVYTFFATDVSTMSGASLGSKLWTTLKRINDNLIEQDPNTAMVSHSVDGRMKVGFPHVSPIVDLNSSDGLYSLAERVVGTESLIFLANQFELLQPHLESVIPASKKAFLQQFYSQTVSVASDLRKPIYRGVASRCMDYDRILQLMMTVKWDIKDIMSQHSPYVDALLHDMSGFSSRLAAMSNKRVPIPQEAHRVLWEHVIRLANRILVEGFACAKKCSNEGRALMQLDFQQFLIKIEAIAQVKPVPDREFVEAYVKAYYLSEADIELWVKEHKEYSAKQLSSLVSCAVGSKKARQRLLNSIEDFEKNRPR
ncbi:syndetin-like [Lytechinus variegatus]|uniref:syndetin-like n=1 Tax=Lytechinus variegatus TaxID=7654 RepID=UPI001BB160C0|nr:syndetin-like [Lytechinus variegatus]